LNANYLSSNLYPSLLLTIKTQVRNMYRHRISNFASIILLCLALSSGGTNVEAASDVTSPEAQFRLGWNYFRGIGVSKDVWVAIDWFRKAAKQNDANAQNMLGVLYATGDGVARDRRQAFKWYSMAAKQGLAVAESNLAWFYHQDNYYISGQVGVNRDVGYAKKLYQSAARKGYSKARDLYRRYFGEDMPIDATVAAAKRKKEREAREQLEAERRRVAEEERIRIAKLEQAKEQEAEERRQRELVRKRKTTDAHERELAPIRRKNKRSFAVIIGNRNYSGRVPTVDFAHNDADAMKQFIIEKLGYREGNVFDLRDAGVNAISALLGNEKSHEGELFNVIRKGQSDVIVYYSGHGVPGLKDERPYLLPVDGDPNSAEITGFSVDTMYANLAKLPARSVTVFLDACFSGESEKGMLVSSASGISVKPKLPSSKSNMIVITAAQGNQLASWDPKARHGLFTKHLLDALNGEADGKGYGNDDGKVSLSEIKNYLDDEMTYQARATWKRRQNAYVRGSGDTILSTVFRVP
jgi:hypothetical protein